jgi:membrane-associated protease RseP (regulator of RpoE activity)
MSEEQKGKRLTIPHVILFFATLFTTLFFGAVQQGLNPLEKLNILKGIPFSFTLLSILGGHELAHYLASRRHRIAASLPYFIPAPTLIGTFGAVIKMKAPIKDRRALLDIGAAGPLSGFIISTIAVVIGLGYSRIEMLSAAPAPESSSGSGAAFRLGSSILFDLLVRVVLNIDPKDYNIFLHPVAFSGWIGLFVTSLNLLPVGQLDGGHIVYAISPEWHRLISKIIIPVLFILGFLGWMGWYIWAVLLIFLGTKHPPLIYPFIPLDKRRRKIGLLCLAIFIFTFSPVPFSGL